MKVELVVTRGDEVPPSAQESRITISNEELRIIILTLAGHQLYFEERLTIKPFHMELLRIFDDGKQVEP